MKAVKSKPLQSPSVSCATILSPTILVFDQGCLIVGKMQSETPAGIVSRKTYVLVGERMLTHYNEMEKKFLLLCYYGTLNEPRALELMKDLLDGGVNVNLKAPHNLTAINLICLSNTRASAVEILGMLLERGADPNNCCVDGASSLHMLIWVNRTDTLLPMASLLIKYGTDINGKQENLESPLHKLLRFNQTDNLLDVVKLFVENGARINEKGGRSKGFGSPLHILCENNQSNGLLDVLSYLVDKGALVNEKDDKNNTVVHILCHFNQTADLLPVVRYVIEKGVDVNARNDQDQTAIELLFQYNQSEHVAGVAQLLMGHGCASTTSRPLFSIVCKYNRTKHLTDVIKLLLETKADPKLTDQEGWQAVHYCAQYQSTHLKEAIVLLGSWGADLESLTNYRESLLHLACQHAEQLDLFDFVSSLPKTLIRKLANISDGSGRTPLHHAARVGCLKTLNYLADFIHYRIVDAMNKCAMEYLDDLSCSNSVTALCLCCKNQTEPVDRDKIAEKILSKRVKHAKLLLQPLKAIETLIPKQIDRVYVVNKFEKYMKIRMTESWKRFMLSWSNNLKPDENDLIRAAESGLGCNRSCLNRNCIRCSLLFSIRSYMRRLLCEVEKLDERFASQQIIFYGSSAEQTKLFELDEFDFLVVLSKFVEDDEQPTTVIFSGQQEEAEFLAHDDGRKGASSGKTVYYFYELLCIATKRVDYANFHVKELTVGETCATLYLTYSGGNEVIDLSVDVTVGVARRTDSKSAGTWKSLPDWCRLANEKQPREVLVPLRDKCGPPEWRVSFPSLERDSILAAGSEVRLCYRLLKLLILSSQPMSRQRNGYYEVPQKTKPSTYVLKTCLFHYMEFNPPPWKQEDTILHCIRILEVYVTNPRLYLMSFFDENSPVAYIDQEAILICLSLCDKLQSYLSNRSNVSLPFVRGTANGS